MKRLFLNLSLVCIFFTMNSTSCEREYESGFDEEPSIQIFFKDGNQNFITQSGSINMIRKNALKNDLPGIDMNANSTKYWIIRNNKTDSFQINYKLSVSLTKWGSVINFDSISVTESSLKFLKEINPNDTLMKFSKFYYRSPYPFFCIIE